MKHVALFLPLFLFAFVHCLYSREAIPQGTIIPCRLENPSINGNWIHWQALALHDVVYRNRIIVHKGHLVARILVPKDLPPSLNGGELVDASQAREIYLTYTGFARGQIISVLFDRKTVLLNDPGKTD